MTPFESATGVVVSLSCHSSPLLVDKPLLRLDAVTRSPPRHTWLCTVLLLRCHTAAPSAPVTSKCRWLLVGLPSHEAGWHRGRAVQRGGLLHVQHHPSLLPGVHPQPQPVVERGLPPVLPRPSGQWSIKRIRARVRVFAKSENLRPRPWADTSRPAFTDNFKPNTPNGVVKDILN